METIIETERLLLREITHQDINDLFEMDSDPEVHRYIENKPVTSQQQIADAIQMLRRQYKENGIARWAVVDKKTGECLGWAGLKYFREPLNHHSNFYELGYRFKQKHWGKGYASESSKAILDYGFSHFDIPSIYAITHPDNEDSIKVLKKSGFEFIEVFDYDGDPTNWFELTRRNWNEKKDLL